MREVAYKDIVAETKNVKFPYIARSRNSGSLYIVYSEHNSTMVNTVKLVDGPIGFSNINAGTAIAVFKNQLVIVEGPITLENDYV